MPRPPTRPSVLRTARQRLGLSQGALAKAVGCAKVTIEKFENGTAGVSDELATRIAFETLLGLDQLLENSNPDEPMTDDGQPLPGRENYLKLKKLLREDVSKDKVDGELNYELARQALLFDAAVQDGKYRLVIIALRQRVSQLIKDFGLEKRFAQEHKRHALPEESSVFYWKVNMEGTANKIEKEREKLYCELKGRRPGKSAKRPEHHLP